RRHPPGSSLFPYTTLFRSGQSRAGSASAASPMSAFAGLVFLELIIRRPGPLRRDRALQELRVLAALATALAALAIVARATLWTRSEEHTSELQSLAYLVCR